jgi:solute carrier family 25 folate transporter 32
MVASCVTYPHEVLRTRLQVHRNHQQRSLAHATTQPPPAMVQPLTHGAPLPPPPFASAAVVPAPPAHMTTPTTPEKGTQKTQPPKGLIAEFKYILKNDGLKGFYRGLSINLVRTVPSNAVTMLT